MLMSLCRTTPWSLQLAFSTGTAFSPSTTALTMIGTKVRSIPSRCLKLSLTFCRKRTTLVISTSATVQACGIVCLLFSMLLAIGRRIGAASAAGAVLCRGFLPRPGARGRNVGVDVVGDDLDQAVVFLRLIAGLLQPFRDGASGDRLAELRHLDRGHQPVI